MDYQTAENQAVQLQNQSEQVAQSVKGLADKLQAKVSDPALSRELSLDLREAALSIQKQNQSTLMLVEQMAQYIHDLESHVNAQPQSGFQTRGWATRPYGGGGFMGSVMSGLGMGAGFGLANDLIGSLF
ncbi:MAG: hypothetical protein KGJ66_03665 [Alphaproteobacteria bacterium]|jgi:hypothetical protein|nr:hypothetical protein [Alphaproteobacteria bacterium]